VRRRRLRRSQNATTFDALSAGFDLLARLADNGMHDLQVRPEQARRDGSHVLTDAAGFLRLTTPQN